MVVEAHKPNDTSFFKGQADLGVFMRGLPLGKAPQLIWAHGWGVDHRTLLPIAQTFDTTNNQVLLDFPGFGVTPPPASAWSAKEYADLAIEWLKTMPKGQRVWIGHSFGVRIGLRIAAKEPELLDALFLIAGAGLRRQRTMSETIALKSKIYAYKALKPMIKRDLVPDSIKNRFGSADYRSAGPMRQTLVRVIQEDLTEIAKRIKCPVQLVYGAQDQETPPEIGQKFASLIPKAKLTVLDHLDHYTILTDGQAQISYLLQQFLEENFKQA